MQKPEIFVTKYTLNDFFNRTIKMLPFTWKNTVLFSLICLTPAFVVMGFGFQQYVDAMSVFMETALTNPEAMKADIWGTLSGFLGGFSLMMASSLLYSLLALFVHGAVTQTTLNTALGKPAGFVQVGRQVLSKFGTLFLQNLLVGLALGGILTGGILAIVLLAALFGGLFNAPFLAGLVIFLAGGALAGVLLWLGISWSFVAEAALGDGCGAGASMGKSLALVRGNFWRVTGISLLISMVLSFAISMVINPLFMGSMMPFYSRLIESSLQAKSPNPAELAGVFREMSAIAIPLMLVSAVSGLLTLLVYGPFRTLFYIDLKVRKGELEDQALQVPAAGDGTAVGGGEPAGPAMDPERKAYLDMLEGKYPGREQEPPQTPPESGA